MILWFCNWYSNILSTWYVDEVWWWGYLYVQYPWNKCLRLFLIIILVLDDFREGILVGWMISNHGCAAIIRQFLLEVRQRCGDIHIKAFSSDDADNFYNTWKGVFTVAETKNRFAHGTLTKVGEKDYISTWHLCPSRQRLIITSDYCSMK